MRQVSRADSSEMDVHAESEILPLSREDRAARNASKHPCLAHDSGANAPGADLLRLQRTQIFPGAPVLRQLDQINGERKKEQNVNGAAFVQHKLQHNPNEQQQTSGVPEHLRSIRSISL